MVEEKKFIIGEILYGFCNGYFGDNYEDKFVIATGSDWVVCRDTNKEVCFTTFENSDEFWKHVEEWRKKIHD